MPTGVGIANMCWRNGDAMQTDPHAGSSSKSVPSDDVVPVVEQAEWAEMCREIVREQVELERELQRLREAGEIDDDEMAEAEAFLEEMEE